MDFVFDLEAVNGAEEFVGGGKKFGTLDTGIYKGSTIVRGSLSKTKNGNNTVDVTVKTADGHETTIYQAFMIDSKWASGSDNKIGYKQWLTFAKVCGLQSGETFQESITKEDGTPVMKNGSPVVLTSLKGLQGKVVDLAIVKSLDFYNGSVTEKNEIYSAYAVGSENSAKLEGRLTDKTTKAYDAYIANASTNLVEDQNDDLGL